MAGSPSDQFFALLVEVRRSQRSYQRSGHSGVPQELLISNRADAAANGIDVFWRIGAVERYKLLQDASSLSHGEFKQAVASAKDKAPDKRLLKSLKLLRHEPPDVALDVGAFEDLPGDWATHRLRVINDTAKERRRRDLDVIDATVKEMRRRDRRTARKEARDSTLSNIAACYLVMRVEDGIQGPGSLLGIASAALSIPPR